MTLENFQILWFIGFPLLCIAIAILMNILVIQIVNKIFKNKGFGYVSTLTDTICIIGWIIGGIICIIIWFDTMFYFDREIKYQYEERFIVTNQIISINDNLTVNGEFYGRRFYIRGYINEQWQYSLYQTINGSYTLINIPASTTVIYEKDMAPHYNQYCTYQLTKQEKIFFINVVIPEKQTGCRYELIIPIGTINNNYELDLQ